MNPNAHVACPECEMLFSNPMSLWTHFRKEHRQEHRYVPAYWNQHGFLQVDLSDVKRAREDVQALLEGLKRGKEEKTAEKHDMVPDLPRS